MFKESDVKGNEINIKWNYIFSVMNGICFINIVCGCCILEFLFQQYATCLFEIFPNQGLIDSNILEHQVNIMTVYP